MPPLPFSPDAPWLAPLAGFSDLPFRLLCRELGAAAAVTEMVSAKGLFYDSRNTRRLLATHPDDAPLVVQLFGAEPEYLRRAVRELAGDGYAFFDLNCGCSVRKVVKTGAGAALLGDPERLVACAAAMAEAAGPGKVGVKLRLGPKPPDFTALPLAERLAGAGIAWLALHPRHASQGFSGTADVDKLAAFVAASPLPVLASGDLMTAEDAVTRLGATGAAGAMYARGALCDPRVLMAWRTGSGMPWARMTTVAPGAMSAGSLTTRTPLAAYSSSTCGLWMMGPKVRMALAVAPFPSGVSMREASFLSARSTPMQKPAVWARSSFMRSLRKRRQGPRPRR